MELTGRKRFRTDFAGHLILQVEQVSGQWRDANTSDVEIVKQAEIYYEVWREKDFKFKPYQ